MLCIVVFAMSAGSEHSWTSLKAVKHQEEVLAKEIRYRRAKLRALRTLLPKARANAGLSKEFVTNYLENACFIADREANLQKRISSIKNIYITGSIGYIKSDHIFSFTAARRSLAESTVQHLQFFPTYLSSIMSRLSSVSMSYVRIMYCFCLNYTFRPRVPVPGSVPVGLFATRSPSRPNQIAMSYARISGTISPDGVLPVVGLDALHLSPILSIEFFPDQACHATISLIEAQLSGSRSHSTHNNRWFSENMFETQELNLEIRDNALNTFNHIVSNTPGYRHLQLEPFIRRKLCAGAKNSRWLPKKGTIGFGRYRIAYSIEFLADENHDSPVQNVTVTHIYESPVQRIAAKR